MPDVRVATRGSRLALAQAAWVVDRLEAAHPGLSCDIVEITTSGDTDQATPVAELTEVGAFVRAVQRAVLDGRADVAVHSGKDLPVAGPPELAAIYPTRETPWDVLCGRSLENLAQGARVGTGSPRRASQLALLRPDLRIDDIRGNVDTRLRKVADGEYDAVILAEAGLRRLGLDAEVTQRFTIDEMVPAPAQAALTVEALRDGPALSLLAAIDDPVTREAVEAERDVLRRTGAGCRSALGVFATRDDDVLVLTGFVADERGPRRATVDAADTADTAGSVTDLIEALELT